MYLIKWPLSVYTVCAKLQCFRVKHGTVYFYSQTAHEPLLSVEPFTQSSGKLPLRDVFEQDLFKNKVNSFWAAFPKNIESISTS